MNIPTRQALPPESYLILLGASLCVFNSNNAFVIENILRTDRRPWPGTTSSTSSPVS